MLRKTEGDFFIYLLDGGAEIKKEGWSKEKKPEER